MAAVHVNRCVHRSRDVGTYWHESKRVRDFVRVMRVRLSQSKVGPRVTPRPIVVDVDLRALVMAALPVSTVVGGIRVSVVSYLAVVSVVGVAAYLGAMRMFYPAALRSLVNLFPHLVPGSLVRGLTRRPLSPSAPPVS